MQKPLAEVAQIMGCSELDLIFVETVVRHSKTSFATGMKILSSERRYGMFALYSFCRIVDDIADEEGSVELKQKQLQEWRDRIEHLYKGKTESSIGNVLLGCIHRFNLKKEDFLAIIDGMDMDVVTPIIAPDEKSLDLYCDRVASAGGRLAIRIFGDSSIPEKCIYKPSIKEVCNIIACRAMDHFCKANNFMKQCDAKAIRPAKMMAITYHLLLRKQRALGWRKPFKRASLSIGEKIIVGIAGLMV